MFMRILNFSLLFFCFLNSAKGYAETYSDLVINKFAFGSCNKVTKDQNHWALINQENADLWLWLGDALYLDDVPEGEELENFDQIKNHPDYAQLVSEIPVIGTWDDHDYAYNNADGNYFDKEGSKERFMSYFLEEDSDSPIWQRKGVYQSKVYGPKGKRVEFVLLDLRTFKNVKGNAKDEKMLGREQWEWLEHRLRTSDADLIFLGSSSSFYGNFTWLGFDGWKDYRRSYKRLWNLLNEIDKRVVILTGDRHWSEIYSKNLKNGRPVVEFMSSGLNNAKKYATPSRHSVVSPVKQDSYGVVSIDWMENGSAKILMEMKSSDENKVLGRYVEVLHP